MSRDVRLYLNDIVEACDRVASYTAGLTFEAFAGDTKTMDAVLRNLEVVGEAAKKVPQSVRLAFEHVPWRRMAALRDVVAHEYFGIDVEIIWDVAVNHLPAVRVGVLDVLLRHSPP